MIFYKCLRSIFFLILTLEIGDLFCPQQISDSGKIESITAQIKTLSENKKSQNEKLEKSITAISDANQKISKLSQKTTVLNKRCDEILKLTNVVLERFGDESKRNSLIVSIKESMKKMIKNKNNLPTLLRYDLFPEERNRDDISEF